MLVEWLRKKKKQRASFNPKDKLRYIVAPEITRFTEQILKEYGQLQPAAEGLVYWAGTIENNIYYITAAVAPQTVGSRYGFFTTHQANGQFVDFISDNDLVYIGQVHSHPGGWVDHSEVDNNETAFRSEGLVSVVVPHFPNRGCCHLYVAVFTAIRRVCLKGWVINTLINTLRLKNYLTLF